MMGSSFIYKGYEAQVSFDPERDVFTGMVLGIPDGIIFEAESSADIGPAFHEAVDDYLAFCVAKKKRLETAA